MNRLYSILLSDAERARVQALEAFDEYEEWHLKCAHYIMAVAHKGTLTDHVRLAVPGDSTSAVADAPPHVPPPPSHSLTWLGGFTSELNARSNQRCDATTSVARQTLQRALIPPPPPPSAGTTLLQPATTRCTALEGELSQHNNTPP